MGAKRFLLIAGGTVGGLGAVLSITPPQFGSTTGGSTSGNPLGSSAATSSSSPTPVPPQPQAAPAPADTSAANKVVSASPTTTKKSSKKSATKKNGTASSATATPSTTPASPTPASTPASSSPTSSGISGTFTGATFDAREPNGQDWGSVTVTVVIKDGKIVSSIGSQSPSSRGPYAFSALDPFFKSNQMTLSEIVAESSSKVISDNLFVSRVTYSSLAYWSSIKSALGKAGI
jgi:hypothetical protein